MSIGQLLFSFNGRIPRSTYWLASIPLSVLGMTGVFTASYLVTGELFSKIVFLQARDRVEVWLPIWAGYMALMFWPGLAIGLKRWHDRNRPTWIYLLLMAAFFIPMGLRIAGYGPTAADLETTGWANNPAVNGPLNKIVSILSIPLSFYFLIELGFLRGTRGPNRFGTDPLPPELEPAVVHPGFGNLMFGLNGRIGRSRWWLGLLVTFGIFTVIVTIGTIGIGLIVPFNDPSIAQKMKDAHWLSTPEGSAFLMKMVSVFMLFVLMLLLPFWNLIAISVKRLHDQGATGWWVLVVIVPFFLAIMAPAMFSGLPHAQQSGYIVGAWLIYGATALWCLLQFGLLEGKAGPNRYGAGPAG